MNIDKCLAHVRKKTFEKNIDLLQVFREFDDKGINIINTVKFTYILNEFLGVSEDQIAVIEQVLDPNNKKLINYQEFVRVINDPN